MKASIQVRPFGGWVSSEAGVAGYDEEIEKGEDAADGGTDSRGTFVGGTEDTEKIKLFFNVAVRNQPKCSKIGHYCLA